MAPIRRQDMLLHLFQLPLCPLPKSRELRLRASHLPSLKRLFQRDGSQLGLSSWLGLVAQSRRQTCPGRDKLSELGCGGAKVPMRA